MAIPYKILKDLSKLTVKINAILDIDKQLNFIVKSINRLLKTEYAAILLVDEESRKFIRQTQLTGQYKYWADFTVAKNKCDLRRIGSGFTDWVLKNKKIKVLNNKTADKQYHHALAKTKCEICLPLIIEEKIIGVLDVETLHPNYFHQENTELLRLISETVSVAIRNAKLTASMKRGNQRLLNLSRASTMINASLNLQTTLKNIAQIAVKTYNYDLVNILLIEQGRLVSKARAGTLATKVGAHTQKLGQGISGMVAVTGKSMIINDVKKDKRYFQILSSTKSEIDVPIKLGNDIIGVFNVESDRKTTFSQNDLLFLTTLADQAAVAIKNAKLYASLELSNKRIVNLSRTSTIVNASLNLNTTLKNIAKIARQTYPHGYIDILLLEKQKLVSKIREGKIGVKVKPYAIKWGEGLVGKTAKTGKSTICNDIRKNKDFIPILKTTKSEIDVPIRLGNDIIGVFNVESDTQETFTQHDLFFLTTLADQAAVAIRNAKTSESLKKTKKRLDYMYRLTKTLNATLHLDKILKDLLLSAKKSLKFDLGSVLLIEKERLYSKAGVGFSAAELKAFSLAIGEGITGIVAKTGKPIMINDTLKDKRYYRQIQATRSELAVPIKNGKQVIGVFNAESKRKNNFSKKDLLFLTSLADHAALAIKNAQLYDQTSNFNKRLTQEVKSQTRTLQNANVELIKLNKVKNDFISTVSHELRTPLTTILGYVDVVMQGDLGSLNAEQRGSLLIVKNDCERLTRLIHDLLDISRIESGKVTFKFKKVAVKEFIEHFCNERRKGIEAKGLTFIVQLPKTLPLILADEDKLKQILTNLFDNALKFTDKGHIAIRVFNEKKYIKIEVEDTGMGIKKEDQKRIFERFSQIDTGVKGTGLGLAITKYLVEMHGGFITVNATYGKGSTFILTLKK